MSEPNLHDMQARLTIVESWNKSISERLRAVERWQWISTGVIIAVQFYLANVK